MPGQTNKEMPLYLDRGFPTGKQERGHLQRVECKRKEGEREVRTKRIESRSQIKKERSQLNRFRQAVLK